MRLAMKSLGCRVGLLLSLCANRPALAPDAKVQAMGDRFVAAVPTD